MAVTRDEVVLAFRLLLEREPTDEQIQHHLRHQDLRGLRHAMMTSSNYRALRLRGDGSLPLVVFIHVPKAAGVSFRYWLESLFDYERVFWTGQGGFEVEKALGIEKLWMFAGLVGGHVTYDVVRQIPRSPKLFIGIVRQPTDAVLSLFNFIREIPTHALHDSIGQMTLHEAVETHQGFRNAISNQPLRYLFGRQSRFEIDPADRYLIGKAEALESLQAEICKALNIAMNPTLPRLNSGKSGYIAQLEREPGYEAAIGKIQAMNRASELFYSSFEDLLILDKTLLAEFEAKNPWFAKRRWIHAWK